MALKKVDSQIRRQLKDLLAYSFASVILYSSPVFCKNDTGQLTDLVPPLSLFFHMLMLLPALSIAVFKHFFFLFAICFPLNLPSNVLNYYLLLFTYRDLHCCYSVQFQKSSLELQELYYLKYRTEMLLNSIFFLNKKKKEKETKRGKCFIIKS